MADDITIQGVSTGTAGSAPAPAQTGAQAAVQTTTAAGTSAASAGVPAVATPVQPQPGTGSKPASTSFSLIAEADAAAQQAMQPPSKFSIPAAVQEKFPDLVELIQKTESMTDDERNYWFQILPIMNNDQVAKFRTILLNEKEQLKRLDHEYEQELTKLNEKHMIEWKEFETKEKRQALRGAEKRSEEEEHVAEEDLLKRLSAA